MLKGQLEVWDVGPQTLFAQELAGQHVDSEQHLFTDGQHQGTQRRDVGLQSLTYTSYKQTPLPFIRTCALTQHTEYCYYHAMTKMWFAQSLLLVLSLITCICTLKQQQATAPNDY